MYLNVIDRVVIVTQEEYENLQEILALLSLPGFKDGFDESVKQADNGEVVSFKEVFGEVL